MESYEQQILDVSINYITPVLESSAIIAGEYSKKCGRDFITSMDFKYAMRFATMNVAGRINGSIFDDDEIDDSDDDEDNDIEIVEECEDDFTRYQGDDHKMNMVNHAYDTWDTWEPSIPLEKILKKSIDSYY
tara:strand:+ start:560 stop:955 length:396 start_codon:yes stop_codon:yes gene_type:complete